MLFAVTSILLYEINTRIKWRKGGPSEQRMLYALISLIRSECVKKGPVCAYFLPRLSSFSHLGPFQSCSSRKRSRKVSRNSYLWLPSSKGQASTGADFSDRFHFLILTTIRRVILLLALLHKTMDRVSARSTGILRLDSFCASSWIADQIKYSRILLPANSVLGTVWWVHGLSEANEVVFEPCCWLS